jgi:hypothetical protein
MRVLTNSEEISQALTALGHEAVSVKDLINVNPDDDKRVTAIWEEVLKSEAIALKATNILSNFVSGASMAYGRMVYVLEDLDCPMKYGELGYFTGASKSMKFFDTIPDLVAGMVLDNQ